MLKMDMDIGVRYPAHRTALGKAILAHRTDSELRKLFRRSNDSLDKLLRQLDVVRQRGYATNNEELFLGYRAVAAPIVNADGRVEAAVSATGPRFRLDDPATIAAVTRAAHDISERMVR